MTKLSKFQHYTCVSFLIVTLLAAGIYSGFRSTAEEFTLSSVTNNDRVSESHQPTGRLVVGLGLISNETPISEAVERKPRWFDVTNSKVHDSKGPQLRIKHTDTNNNIPTSAVTDCTTGAVRGVLKISREELIPFSSSGSKVGWNRQREAPGVRQAAFQRIYHEGTWTLAGRYPRSGLGSTLNYTIRAQRALDSVINFIKSQLDRPSRVKILDVPCGDMTWMREFLSERGDIDYTGIDIVPELIQAHRSDFAANGWKFKLHDIVSNGLDMAYDLVFSRMMLQHLYSADALAFLDAVSRSGSKFFLTTTFPSVDRNWELITAGDAGRFRPFNLQVPPVSLPTPLCYSRDSPNEETWHYLALWRLPLSQVTNCTRSQPLPLPLDSPSLKYFGCSHLLTTPDV